MMCTTVLHGGVCHRTSTPHKIGNKMKEKKKKLKRNTKHKIINLTVYVLEVSMLFFFLQTILVSWHRV